MITIHNLIKSYGKLEVLRGIHLELKEPGVTAILGPNGSGKTTLLKCLLGMVIPQHGQIIFDGRDIRNDWQYRRYLSYAPQIAKFPNNLTILEFLEMIKDIRGVSSTAEQRYIHLFDLASHLKMRLGTLSGGTKQKVNLTAALMFDAPYLFLDEPIAGLDPVALIRFKDLLKEEKAKGKQIILTTHIMSIVEDLADEILFILDGKIYFRGTLSELLERYQEPTIERAIARILNPGFQDIDITPQPRENLTSQPEMSN
ncbi:MAG TPA: ABC transporter ATP-binding protein [Saprospiraceae bacterium]|nr:ABC transporter ATP-binding protein [Saprospiraceae bacterium]